MVRLLARVTKILKREKHPAVGNFNCEKLSLRIRIEGSARKPIRIPPGLKGRQCTITRSCLKQWLHKKGDYIILNEEESKQCIRKFAKPIRKRKWNDFVIEDSNRDGFAEYSYTNDFLKAVIAPHYGARLLQLWNQHHKANALYGGKFYMNKGYIELGGIEETLSKQGKPDELWNARFKREKSPAPNILSFSQKMKGEKGVLLRKEFSFFSDLPLLLETAILTFNPEKPEKKKQKGKHKKKRIHLAHRIFFAIGGMPDFTNLFHIPGKNGLRTVRFNRPLFKRGWDNGNVWWQWQHCHFTPDPGVVMLENEKTSDILLIFFDKRKLEFLWTGDKKKTPRLQITYKEKRLEPKGTAKYHLLLATAHCFARSRAGIMFVTAGASNHTTLPLSFTYYAPTRRKKPHISLYIDTRSEQLMKKQTIPGIPGQFFTLHARIPKGTKAVRAAIKETDLKVRWHSD